MNPHLTLRNGLAECLVEALVGSGEGESVRALAEFARRADENGAAGGLSPEAMQSLTSAGDFFRIERETVRLLERYRSELVFLRDRALRFEEALDRLGPTGEEDPIERALRAASVLFELELFFELHEVLEPLWQKSTDPLRTFLQGLIQVAVGFHHEQRGNLRGASSLLRDGLDKLRPFRPEAWGIELERFCDSVENYRRSNVTADSLRGDEPPPRPRLARTRVSSS